MRRLLFASAATAWLMAGSVAAQETHEHAPAAPADPHAGHDMSAMTAPAPPADAPPPAPGDRAADRFHPPRDMAAARAQLAIEHGGGRAWKVMLSAAEWRPKAGADDYEWRGEAWYGGDLNRVVVKTEGEGSVSGDLHSAELQGLYSRAIGPYFDAQVGLRHDVEPGPSRTYAVVGVEGLAPYWFEVGAAAFLSEKGDLLGRLEGAHDLRLTQRLILESRVEVNLAAQGVAEHEMGSGLTDGEAGLRLRYQFRPEFAPYVGVVHLRKFGRTADLARAAGEDVEETAAVVGVRAWF